MLLRSIGAILVLLLVIVTPALSMTTAGAGSSLFYGLVLLTVIGLVTARFIPAWRLPGFWQQWRVLVLGMLSILLSVTLHQLWHQEFSGATFERAVRFAWMLPLVWLFMHLRPGLLRHVQWGLIAGTLVVAWLLIFPDAVFGTRPDTAAYTLYNTVSFSNLTLLFAVMTLFTLGWRLTRWRCAEGALKVFAGMMGLYGFLVSETRTGWLAVPVFLLIAVLAFGHVSLRKRLLAVLAVLLVAVGLYTTNDAIQRRVGEGIQQWQACHARPLLNSSICIRLQLARAGLEMWKEQPLFGVGSERFGLKLAEMGKRGLVSVNVAKTFGETHNDMIYYLAAYGLLGVGLGLFVAYFVPAWYFFRQLIRSENGEIRTAAAMGLCVCLGFAVFGISEMMFRVMRTISLYAIWISVMLVLAYPRVSSLRRTP